MPPRIELVARREKDLQSGYPDFSIWAGEQRVGRIHQTHSTYTTEHWFWAINTVTLDATVGIPTEGYADSFEASKTKFRWAFDRWLEWARAMPRGDMKYLRISGELGKMGTT